MSTFNNPPYSEGDALSPTNLNTGAGSLLATPVNDLDESSIERHALSAQHVPELSMPDDIFTNGYESTAVTAASAGEVYSNSLPMSAANTAYPYTYQTFDTLVSGTSVAYYGGTGGVSPNPHGFLGWRIPSQANSTSVGVAQVDLAVATNFTTARIKGVICRGSVEPVYGNLALIIAGAIPYLGCTSLAIAIGWEDGAGNRHVVERSVRLYSVEACRQGNAATFTFLRQTDLDVGDGTCVKIFMVIATARPGAIAVEGAARGAGAANDDDDVYIKYYNLSVTPLQAGDL